MGGAGLRGAHTERRCAGVVGGAGLAGGEMSEDPLDDLASSLRERHFRGAASRGTGIRLTAEEVAELVQSRS